MTIIYPRLVIIGYAMLKFNLDRIYAYAPNARTNRNIPPIIAGLSNTRLTKAKIEDGISNFVIPILINMFAQALQIMANNRIR